MSEMVERVARVIWAQGYGNGVRPEEASDAAIANAMPYARAAIEAMREPTPKMVEAMHRADPLACDVDDAAAVYPPSWRAGIDAALNEEG